MAAGEGCCGEDEVCLASEDSASDTLLRKTDLAGVMATGEASRSARVEWAEAEAAARAAAAPTAIGGRGVVLPPLAEAEAAGDGVSDVSEGEGGPTSSFTSSSTCAGHPGRFLRKVRSL